MNTGQDNAQRKLHNRIFSEDFKKLVRHFAKVKELDDKTISICQLAEYRPVNFVLHKPYHRLQMVS
jgi:hypothetical protein